MSNVPAPKKDRFLLTFSGLLRSATDWRSPKDLACSRACAVPSVCIVFCLPTHRRRVYRHSAATVLLARVARREIRFADPLWGLSFGIYSPRPTPSIRGYVQKTTTWCNTCSIMQCLVFCPAYTVRAIFAHSCQSPVSGAIITSADVESQSRLRSLGQSILSAELLQKSERILIKNFLRG